MRQEKQAQSMHYYHSYAVHDRILILGLSNVVPSLKEVPLLSIPVTKGCFQASI
jgi:hypothetical protein